jgi:hypothetical protein
MTSRGVWPLLGAAILVLGCGKKKPTSEAPTPVSRSSARTPTVVVEEEVPERPTATEETPAGPMTIAEGARSRQRLLLRGKVIYPPATCAATDAVCTKLRELADGFERLDKREVYAPLGSKDKVILFQAGTMGNACFGASFFFVRFRQDGSHRVSEPIDYCGGPKPKITRTGDVIRISVPAHEPNRGDGLLPAWTSDYDLATDTLKKVK